MENSKGKKSQQMEGPSQSSSPGRTRGSGPSSRLVSSSTRAPAGDPSPSAGQRVAPSKGCFLQGCGYGWGGGVERIPVNGTRDGQEPGQAPRRRRAPSLARTPGTKGPGHRQVSPHRVKASEGGTCDPHTSTRSSLHPTSPGSENGWCWGRSHHEPGRPGSPYAQGGGRAEPEDGHYRQSLLSGGQFLFKPDSFVFTQEVMLSLWHVEP